MEAVGRLAGGVAHDFNNLLTIIRGNSDLLKDREGADAFHQKCVEQIQKAAGRAVSMTRQLLAFSRMQVLQPRVLDLNASSPKWARCSRASSASTSNIHSCPIRSLLR